MGDPPAARQSAFRGIWGGVVIAFIILWSGAAAQNLFPPNSDVVTDLFRRFFETFRFWPGLAILAGLAYTVARRVDRGDPIKEDLNLLLTIAGLILSLLSLFPGVRDRVVSAVHSLFAQ